VDPALAIILIAAGLIGIWTRADEFAGPRLGDTVFLVLVCLPLARRRRSPLGTLAVVTVAVIAWTSAWYFDRQPPFEPFVALLLCTYAVAAGVSGRAALAGAALVVAFVASELIAVVAGNRPTEGVAGWVLLALTWALGRVVHRHHTLSTELARRAAELEREREETARLAAAVERARIARDLHDVVTHTVSVMVVQAGVERRALGDENASTRDVLGSIEDLGREALVELRRLLGVLRRDDVLALAPQPTLESLAELLAQSREAGVAVELRIEGERRPLPAGVELSAYRIVQEALTNVRKHAGPTRAEVTVRYAREAVELEIADDGRGPLNGSAGGHGLMGMRERVALHRGSLETGARNEGGFVVRARLPVSGS
jgi:signal transduction histidine kinase